MKNKEDVMDTLEMILTAYDNFRFCCKMSEEKSKHQTLMMYSDFYEWLYGNSKDEGER